MPSIEKKNKKLACLFFGGNLITEMKLLQEELLKNNVVSKVIGLDNLELESLNPDIIKDEFEKFDFIYYRTGLGDGARNVFGKGLAEVRTHIFNRIINENPLISNKIYQSATVKNNGVLVPRTFFGRHIDYETLKDKIGLPFIFKEAEGIQGKKVYMVRDEPTYLEHKSDALGDILFQEYIPNSGDYRVFVIGNKVHEIYKRIPPSGSFKANYSAGGSGERVVDKGLCTKLCDIAIKVCETLSLEIAGVDLMVSEENGQVYFIEANVNPGWKGLDATVGCNTAKVLADYFVSNY